MRASPFRSLLVPAPSDSRAYWATQVLLPFASILLSFVVLTTLVEGTALLLGLSVTGIGFPSAIVGTTAWTALRAHRSTHPLRWRSWFAMMITSVMLMAACLVLSGRVLDDTWDSQWFHQEAVFQLADGWNPVKGPLTEQQVPDLGARTRIDGYAKGPWIWGASLYRLTHRIERAKAFSGPLVIAAIATTFAALLLVTRLHSTWAFVCALLTACNPVSVVQITNVQLDGPMSSLFIIMVASSVMWFTGGSRLSLATATAAAATVASVKLSGPVFVVIIAGGLLAVGWFFRLLDGKHRDLMWAAPLGAVAALMLTAGTYVTNWVYFGNPLYPVRGDAPIAIVTAAQEHRFEAFVFSALSRSSVQLNDEIAGEIILDREELKVPFTWTGEELLAFRHPNVRVGGWGPLSGGLLILGALAALVGAFTDHRRFVTFWVVSLPLVAGIIIVPMFWKARYVPHTWIVVMAVTIWLMESRRSRSARILGWLMLSVIALNLTLISSAHFPLVARHSADLKHRLLKLNLRLEPLQVDFGGFRATRFRLAELGIPFTEVTDPDCNIEVYLGRVPLKLDEPILGSGSAGGQTVTLGWKIEANVSPYLVEVVQPAPFGPGEGALTVVQRVVNGPPATIPLPSGPSNVTVSRCNRIGCGLAGLAGPFDTPRGSRSEIVIGHPENGAVITNSSTYLTWLPPDATDRSEQAFEVELSDANSGEIWWTRKTTDPWVHSFFSRDSEWRLTVRTVDPTHEASATSVFRTQGVAAPTITVPSNSAAVLRGEESISWSEPAGAASYELQVLGFGSGRSVFRNIFKTSSATVRVDPTSPGERFEVRVRACLSQTRCRTGSEIGWGPWSDEAGTGHVELIAAR